MKKMKLIVSVCAIIFIVGTIAIAAASYDPGSDPFISLSYLTEIFKPQMIDDIKEEISADIAKQIDEKLGAETEEEETEPTVSMAYEVVHLFNGQRIEALSSCEIILRAGMAESLVTSAENIANGVGLSNVTEAKEILNGESVPINNYIIIPRADGRAVVVTSNDAYFMVRGDYIIVG
ncbi:MAG: hypothetical protein E7623_03375 [Ruminococcaceae bacterium]|nr:hypothetical protein [Oscillospiraceae bacterium]